MKTDNLSGLDVQVMNELLMDPSVYIERINGKRRLSIVLSLGCSFFANEPN